MQFRYDVVLFCSACSIDILCFKYIASCHFKADEVVEHDYFDLGSHWHFFIFSVV